MLSSSLVLSSVVGAIGRAGLRKEVGLLRPGPRGLKVLWHQMVQWCAGARKTRDGDTGNEDDSSFAGFLNLTIGHVQFCHDKWLVKSF